MKKAQYKLAIVDMETLDVRWFIKGIGKYWNSSKDCASTLSGKQAILNHIKFFELSGHCAENNKFLVGIGPRGGTFNPYDGKRVNAPYVKQELKAFNLET